MKAKLEPQAAIRDTVLDYRDTVALVEAYFGWKPGLLTRALIKAISPLARPLEQGSYQGRSLPGEPHRARWVIAGPLTVFALDGATYRCRLLLAARLRHYSELNVIDVAPGQRKGVKVSPRRMGKSARKRAAAAARVLSAGITGRHPAACRDTSASGDLELLLAIQRNSSATLSVVPVARASHQVVPDAPSLSFAGRLERFKLMSVVRKTTSLARTLRTGSLKNGRSVALAPWLVEAEGELGRPPVASELRKEIAGRMISERRACSGPPSEPAWQVKRKVLADPLLEAHMQEYALVEGLESHDVLHEAKGYLDEIASDYRVGVARWFCRFVDWMFDRFLEGVEVDRHGIRFLSECDSRSRIVLVCSHKSYLDPLLIGYTLFRSGMVPPQQAAGLNLSFWPVGWLLRHSGAFYLRRRFAGETTLYREVFSAYVRHLLAGNYTSAVYIEGTRSRDGKLARPKLGYLGILAECLRMGVCADITLVPVYLGYDKVPEESAHVREMAGGRKVSESVKGFTRIFNSVNTRFGKAYVKFGTPMSMTELLGDEGLEGAAVRVCEGINSITPITARSIAAAALLSSGQSQVTARDVEQTAGSILSYAEEKTLPVSADPGTVMSALDWLAVEGHITRGEPLGAEAESFVIKPAGRRFLEYNKNIPIHHFIDDAVRAVARKRAGSDYAEGVVFLKELLFEEFVFAGGAGDGTRKDARVEEALAAMLEPFLEGCLLAADTLHVLDDGEEIPREEYLDILLSAGDRLLRDGSMRRVESVSKVMTLNALKSFARMGLVEERRTAGVTGKEQVVLARGERFDGIDRLTGEIKSFLQPAPSPYRPR